MANTLISFLGTGDYQACTYRLEDRTSGEVIFVQEALAQTVCKDWNENDRFLVFHTEAAQNKQWTDLKGRLDQYPFQVRSANIPDGVDKESIWIIFSSVYELLEEGEEIHYDITHGWRYLPMLGLTLLKYASVLKATELRGIYYGAFEGKDEWNIAPILELGEFVDVQDWTLAADQFMRFGATKGLKELSEKEYKPILRETRGQDEGAKKLRGLVQSVEEMSRMMRVCDGPGLMKGEIFKKIREQREELRERMPPAMEPVLDRLIASIQGLDEVQRGEGKHGDDPNAENGSEKEEAAMEMFKNGLGSVQWCIDNGLAQQGFTLLQESLISYYALKQEEDHLNDKLRGAISSAFKIKEEELPQKEWKVDKSFLPFVENLVRDEDGEKEMMSKELSKLYNKIGKKRNEINHARFNKKAMKGLDYDAELKNLYQQVCRLFHLNS